jgi:Tol biopolymer transport system component
LAACAPGQSSSFIPTVTSTEPVITQQPTSTFVPGPIVTVAPSEMPEATLQLTFISDRHLGYAGIYSVRVGCLDEAKPCFGEAEMLFEKDYEISAISWSPTGDRIAFSAVGNEGKQDIFVASWDGQNVTNLTESPAYEAFPAWSRDGSRIAYEACAYEGCRLISSNPEGTDREPLLSLADTRSPRMISWSPNGQQIAFVDYDKTGAREQIYVANLDGSGLVQLTDEPTVHFSPAFSPDGHWIAFVRYEDAEALDRPNILMIDPNGAQEVNLTTNSIRANFPAWLPLGNWIAFEGVEAGKHNVEVYLVRPDGTHLANVTESRSSESFPAWRRINSP